MFRFISSAWRLTIPTIAAILLLGIAADFAQAQFRRFPIVRSPAALNVAGFNPYRNFVPNPIGINLNPAGMTPAMTQYLQSTRNNIIMANAAAQQHAIAQSRSSLQVTALLNQQQALARRAAFPINHPLAYANLVQRYNPYWYGAYNPYASPYYSQVYSTPYMYGSNYGSGYGGGYGMYYGNQSFIAPLSAPQAPSSATTSTAPRTVTPVGAFSVPTKEDGSIAWPFAFRLMSPDAKRELLDPLASQLEIVATQAARGTANPNLIRESQQSVDRLYHWLRVHRLDLAEGSVREANTFLGRVDAALRAMRPEA